MTWQPIETAPKDGTRILTVSSNGIRVVCWDSGWMEGWFIGLDKDFRGGSYAQNVTHWMPLPEPPSTVTSTERGEDIRALNEEIERIRAADTSTDGGDVCSECGGQRYSSAALTRPVSSTDGGSWIDQNYQIDRYGVALMMIREGCADPAGLARRILGEFTSTVRDETVRPHIYMPDYQAMGDCRVCGHEQDKPWHALTRPDDYCTASGEAFCKSVAGRMRCSLCPLTRRPR